MPREISQSERRLHCRNLFLVANEKWCTVELFQISNFQWQSEIWVRDYKFSVKDIFDFSDEIRYVHIESDHLLASYVVTALFTNVPLNETIQVLVDKAFTDDWFNKTLISYPDLTLPLEI